jgi:hypothetical protein
MVKLPLLFLCSVLPLSAADFSRDLSPDRPNTTDSPMTLDPGAFQIETGSFDFTKDREGGVTTRTWTIGETEFRYGLDSSKDIQLSIDPWIHQHSSDGTSHEGFGDIGMRMKWNFWGDDGGTTAFGMIPYLTIPTRTAVSDDAWESGVGFPLSVQFSDKWNLGVEGLVARAWDHVEDDHEWKMQHSITLSYNITKTIGVFAEYVGVTGAGTYQASADVGMSWNLTNNFACDFMVAGGLSDAADDLEVAQGFTYRF